MQALPTHLPLPDIETLLGAIERLVSIESPTGCPSGVNAVLDAVETHFAGTCAKLERWPTTSVYGDILRVRMGGEGPGILILSHADTVHPLGTLQGPLPIRRDGDTIYGPGIYDMKAGFMIAIAAMKRIMLAGEHEGLPITLLLTPDEEAGSPVSRSTIEAEAKKHRYVLVTEPARDGGKIVTARKGVGRFTISAKGVPAHVGTGHAKGRSGIGAMAPIISTIEGFTDDKRGITTNIGLISGGSGVNVVPEHCTIHVDLRVCDLASGEEMVSRIHALKSDQPDITLTITGGMNRPPFARNAGIDALFMQAAAIAADIGFTLESVPLTGGGSDGNFTANLGIPTLDGLGVDGDGAHTHHEHILISSVAERTLFMQGLLEKLR